MSCRCPIVAMTIDPDDGPVKLVNREDRRYATQRGLRVYSARKHVDGCPDGPTDLTELREGVKAAKASHAR